MKLTEAKLKKLILEAINESDWRPELDAEGEREERQRLAMNQRGRRMRAFDRIPMSDKWDDWEKRHKSKIVKKQSGKFGEHSTLDYYLWSPEPMRDLTTHHYGDYWTLDDGDPQGDPEYYVVKRSIGPSEDERAYQDAMSESYYDSKYRASEPGDHDKILGLIQSGNWAQAFSFLELGAAQEWPEDAKTDLVWDIYEEIEKFHEKNIWPLERLIYRYDTQNNPFISRAANIPTPQEVDGKGGLRDRVAQLEEEEQKLKLLVADLLGFPEDWWENRGEYDMDWEGNFKRAGII